MSSDADQIRGQIEVTRGTLSADVNSLADSVKPGNVARRQASKVREAATNTRDRIMGTVGDLADAGSSAATSAGSATGGVASSSREALASAPDTVRAQTRGNPLAAALISFGTGWLVASLIPPSRREQLAVAKLKENSSAVTGQAGDIAGQVAEHLRAPAQEAVDAVKTAAVDAGQTVRAEGTAAAQDLQEQGKQATQTVQDSRS